MEPRNTNSSSAGRSKISVVGGGVLTLCALAGALTACGNKDAKYSQPVVRSIVTTEVATPPASAFRLADRKAAAALQAGSGPVSVSVSTPSASPAVVSSVTMSKRSLLERVFLYGSDLQYSSIGDAALSLIQQAQTVGHVAVYFRIVDDKLQMLQDQKSAFESDVNHPERLIHEFPIVAQDADTVTVRFNQASPVLNTVVSGLKAAAVRTSWVRSVQFVPQGEYLMFETSLELADGTIAEFMETFFPRDLAVPASARALLNDAALEPLADRYRLLDAGDIYLDVPEKGRVKTKVASRFAATPGTTIDWYVTPNVPDDYLPQIKTAIEGWNRYSQKMWSRDIISFKGKLPAGVKIGDPRYNIVNWDSVAQAGAAYESQATDPYTGFTTHALVYLPKAWVNIGKTYWDNGGPSEAQAAATKALRAQLARGIFLGQRTGVTCIEEAAERIALEARLDSVTFSKELLKGVLFHEVGHALGLAHNFKASLSFDPDDAESAFSTSIMDYNQYQLEKAAFDSVDVSTGPLLEYDRQILSVLYNDGKDVASADPTLPACADEEADDEDGGVDPLCIRYDAGHDPTLQLSRTIELLRNESTVDRATMSLPLAIKGLVNGFVDSSSLKDKDGAEKAMKALATSLKGVVSFYYQSGAQSLSYMARANVRSVRMWKDSTLPDGAKEYVEADMRRRAFEGLRYAVTAEAFEPATRAAIDAFKSAAKTWAASTDYVLNLKPDDQAEAVTALLKSIDAAPASLEKSVLTTMRARIYADLNASVKSPYYFAQTGGQTMDFERETAQMLARAATEPLTSGAPRVADERVAAAKALKTFAGTAAGGGFVTDAAQALLAQAKAAHDLTARNDALAAYRALTQEEKSDDK